MIIHHQQLILTARLGWASYVAVTLRQLEVDYAEMLYQEKNGETSKTMIKFNNQVALL